jgi:FtsP/CotA-like multicopper oxidase with cupredoxin domain
MHRVGEKTSIAEVQKILEQGLVPLRSLHSPLKDTVTVPDGGFTVIRLRASNPG